MARRDATLILAAIIAGLASAAACGGLDDGQINIVDGDGGKSSGGKGGSPSDAGFSGSLEPSSGAGGLDAGAGGETQVVGSGGASGEAGSGGALAGAGGASGAPGAGGTPACDNSSSCGGTEPICESEACRACASDLECGELDSTTPHCASTGSCVECLEDSDCTAAAPVCGRDDSRCRPCAAHTECSSNVCDDRGRCAPTSDVVYALAETGSSATTCGTSAQPCMNLQTAATKLTASRKYLVLVPTRGKFISGATLPAVDVSVIGNDVVIAPYDGSTALTVTGASAKFHGLVIDHGADVPVSESGSIGIACTSAKLRVERSSFVGAETAIDMNACEAVIEGSTFTANRNAVVSSCPEDICGATGTQTLAIERSLFENNTYPVVLWGKTFLIRNNIFAKNGNTAYARTLSLHTTENTGVFAYNTLVANDNQCSYVGILSCSATTECGTVSSNLSWNNFPGQDCPDQVYPSGITLTNSLSETTWPGTGNVSADPRFVDEANGDYTPGSGSPAIDKGSTAAAILPAVDFFGRPRSVGRGPDIGAIEVQ